MTLGQRRLTLRASVAEEIRRLIMSGQLAPGERLFEDRLAEQLGASQLDPVVRVETEAQPGAPTRPAARPR